MEIRLCQDAIRQWQAEPYAPGLKFEFLGSESGKNHWSIRASRELRVILAVEFEDNRPKRAAVMNIGHHDAMYDWSRRRRYQTDLDDPSTVLQADHPAARRTSGADPAVPPADFDEWMLFLSPKQRRLVERHHTGAARIRGAAGTGKTVLALHRAAVLGRRYADQRILVTTFSRSLCVHAESLFRRLPDAPENVVFRNVDALAAGVLGDDLPVHLERVNRAFESAYRETVPDWLAERVGKSYLREEIRRVIKGRDARKEEYLDTGRFERLGRIQSFRLRDREICWQLREAWDREMRRLGTVSFEDRLVAARDRVRKESRPAYRSAIIDEGQDMTLVGVQFVRGLVAGPPSAELLNDSILVLDDSAQRIYSGGFRPAWADLDYSRYSDTIRTNYRNCRSIFEAARAVRGDIVVAQDGNDDGAATDVQFERDQDALPVLLRSATDETTTVLESVEKLVRSGFRDRDIGVLMLHNSDADAVLERFSGRDIPAVGLKELRSNRLGPGVRVGTFDRAKGLEFRAVYIMRVGRSRFPFDDHDSPVCRPSPDGTDAPQSGQELELRQLRLDRLYVAMTRARDRLFLVADEEPCREIGNACASLRIGELSRRS